MGKTSKKKPAKAAPASRKLDTDNADTTSTPRRGKRSLDPSIPPQENPYFSVAVWMLTFAFVLLYRLSPKIYAHYFEKQKDGEL